jgi:hypothetical protein
MKATQNKATTFLDFQILDYQFYYTNMFLDMVMRSISNVITSNIKFAATTMKHLHCEDFISLLGFCHNYVT